MCIDFTSSSILKRLSANSLQKAEISFKKQLIANDFGNEDAYLSACLSEAERKILQERASALDLEQAELDALQMDRKFSLEELRRQHVSDLTLEEAEERKIQAAALLKELRQTMEAVSGKLKEEKGLSLKRAELAERVEKQRLECQRWEKLNDLIGSPDELKCLDFMQELTLEILIRNANRQLQKMADRYVIVKDEDNILSLGVIDKSQAGVRRPAKELSEEENFIVSLALASGFSRFSRVPGQKDKMDSVFLITSNAAHVEALKEHITAQIEIVPQEDGRSLINAPGCTCNAD
jgi:exonuclease SbcC